MTPSTYFSSACWPSSFRFLLSDFWLHLSAPLCLKRLPRLQEQPVDRSSIHRRVAERHRKVPAVVPGFELVAVVRAKHLARFSKRDDQNRIVEIGEVVYDAHGGSMDGRGRLNGSGGSSLAKGSDIKKTREQW